MRVIQQEVYDIYTIMINLQVMKGTEIRSNCNYIVKLSSDRLALRVRLSYTILIVYTALIQFTTLSIDHRRTESVIWSTFDICN